jgi:hypothetical protein
MLKIVWNVEVCDATKDDFWTAVGHKKIKNFKEYFSL